MLMYTSFVTYVCETKKQCLQYNGWSHALYIFEDIKGWDIIIASGGF